MYYNTIYNNTINGLHLKESNNNTISRNVIYNHNSLDYLFSNIFLDFSSNNIINDNLLYLSNIGINLHNSANNNEITNNNIYKHSEIGIRLEYVIENKIINNNLENNSWYGLFLTQGSQKNVICFNEFSGNGGQESQANDDGSTNIFDGNYWFDFVGVDVNDDDMIDDPYTIDGNSENADFHPLVDSNAHILLPITIITPNSTGTFSGQLLIEWTISMDSYNHPVFYTLYYSSNGGGLWDEIVSKITDTQYLWDIGSKPSGSNYLLKVVVTDELGLSSFYEYENPFTIKEKVIETIVQVFSIFTIILSFIIVIISFVHYKLKAKNKETFTEFIKTNQIEYIKELYHKVIIGIENVKSNLIKPTEENPKLTSSNIDQLQINDQFSDEIKKDLRSKLKMRTVLTLTEIAYQNPSETNLVKLSKLLDLPTSTLSDEIKKLLDLEYIEYYATTKVLEDARYKTYSITPKGFNLLNRLKDTLQMTISYMKESQTQEMYA
ncbi:MAG: right-handed parallel beta-helix repeat-containing protein [Candidatus Hodarchaeales archaeon]